MRLPPHRFNQLRLMQGLPHRLRTRRQMKDPPQHLRDPFDPEFLVPPLDLKDLLPDRRTHPRRPRLLPGGSARFRAEIRFPSVLVLVHPVPDRRVTHPEFLRHQLRRNAFFQKQPHGFPFRLVRPPEAVLLLL